MGEFFLCAAALFLPVVCDSSGNEYTNTAREGKAQRRVGGQEKNPEDFYHYVCSVVSPQPPPFTLGEWCEGALWSSHEKVRACRQRWHKVSLCVIGSNPAPPVCWSVNKVSMFAPKAS